MTSAPFSITPILMTVLLAGAVVGAVVGFAIANIGVSNWLVAALCGFLPGFVVSPLRASMEKDLVELSDVAVKPYTVNLAGCIGLSIGVALVAAYLLVSLAGLPTGGLSGALIGLLSGTATALAMTLRRAS